MKQGRTLLIEVVEKRRRPKITWKRQLEKEIEQIMLKKKCKRRSVEQYCLRTFEKQEMNLVT